MQFLRELKSATLTFADALFDRKTLSSQEDTASKEDAFAALERMVEAFAAANPSETPTLDSKIQQQAALRTIVEQTSRAQRAVLFDTFKSDVLGFPDYALIRNSFEGNENWHYYRLLLTALTQYHCWVEIKHIPPKFARGLYPNTSATTSSPR